MPRLLLSFLAACLVALAGAALAAEPPAWPVQEADFTISNFHFRSGETLPELRIHYRTLGSPHYDPQHHITNAVLLLHGTGGSGANFLQPSFGGELFGLGQPFDIEHYYIILPDGIGHGKSSKPSDGLRAKFPHYDYDDMVEAQHRLVKDGLKIDRLRLILGTSMGCMHSFVWGETYPGDVAAMASFACLPVRIVGRNGLWRRMVIEAIKSDPAWQNGDYKEQPAQGLRVASDFLQFVLFSPLVLQQQLATPEEVEASQRKKLAEDMAGRDANDLLYQVDASRDYDPSAGLEKITAQVLWINSADDFINPPELGIAQHEAPRLKHGRFVLLPIGENTHGHTTYNWAVAWQDRLAAFMTATEGK
jgi:homoserine O-acetyltransferase